MTWRAFGTSSYRIEYNIDTDGFIKIKNDGGLKKAVDLGKAYDVARSLRTSYENFNDEDFNVSLRSIAFEIIGHVYPDTAAKNIKKISFIPDSLKKSADSIINHTSIIDCGESKAGDNNRWFWDSLAIISALPLYALI